jgi:hypothetical protein
LQVTLLCPFSVVVVVVAFLLSLNFSYVSYGARSLFHCNTQFNLKPLPLPMLCVLFLRYVTYLLLSQNRIVDVSLYDFATQGCVKSIFGQDEKQHSFGCSISSCMLALSRVVAAAAAAALDDRRQRVILVKRN